MRNRLLIAPLAAVALIGAVIAAPASAGTASSKPCATSNLVVLVQTPGSGTAGSVYYQLEITNLGNAVCTVSGYPRVTAVDLHGRKVGAAATQEPGKKAKPVKLARGDSAFANLQVVEAGNYSASDCKPAWAAGVRVSFPGASGSKVAPLPFETCALSSAKILAVGPFTTAPPAN